MWGGRLPETRKQKNMSNFWPKRWSQSLKEVEWWSLMRELLKQYLTEKQNGCLRSGRYERVDCNNNNNYYINSNIFIYYILL